MQKPAEPEEPKMTALTIQDQQDSIISMRQVSRLLDELLPQRTRPVEIPDPCGSCLHDPDVCACICC